ncbi:MAG: efflux RND transporter periplasmic adaptor subunit [Myxococcales bacterium]|nr:efflux RND transporter periplasmic adaptor subunit [Myxococcales bacterium]
MVALVTLVAVFAWWMSTRRGDQSPATNLRTSLTTRRDITKIVEATGRLETETSVAVIAGTEGRLRELLVKPGQRVQSDEVLARLDAQQLELEVQALASASLASRAQVAEAVAAVKQLEVQLARLRRLASRSQSSAVSVENTAGELERAQAHERAARAAAAAAAARWSAGKMALASTEVRAPIAGWVLRVPEQVGMNVTPAGPVLFIIGKSLENLRLRVDVGEVEVGQIRVHQRAQFEVPAYPGEAFAAEVEQIGLMANMIGGLARYPVELQAENASGQLRPGMTVAVRFEVAVARQVLSVHDAALRYAPSGAGAAADRTRIFVLRGEEVVEVQVETGLSDGVFTEVRPVSNASLEAGELVVVGGEPTRLESSSRFTLGGGG